MDLSLEKIFNNKKGLGIIIKHEIEFFKNDIKETFTKDEIIEHLQLFERQLTERPKKQCMAMLPDKYGNMIQCNHYIKEEGKQYCGYHRNFDCKLTNCTNQCQYIKYNGDQCLRAGKFEKNSKWYCGHHQFCENDAKIYQCIHYDDELERQCNEPAKNDSWVCKYHKKEQSDYVTMYKCENHKSYEIMNDKPKIKEKYLIKLNERWNLLT